MFEWVLTLLSILGNILNIQKKKSSWLIWSAANIGWIISFSMRRMPAEATLFLAYLGLSSYGYYHWRKLEREEDSKER